MKKLVSLLLCIAMIFGMTAVPVSATTEGDYCEPIEVRDGDEPVVPEEPGIIYSEGLAYSVNEDGTTCTVTGIGTCTDTEIYIPESIDGYTVTGVGNSAFDACRSLTSIEIPDGVTSIGNYAFYGCSNLTSINIPDSVTSIGWGAFSGCSGLTSITVDPDNSAYHSSGNCIIETESKTLIAGCSTSIIPSDGSVTSIGNWAFGYCSSLTSIDIPDSVTSIGDWAFFDCDRLTSIEIPSSVTSIGYNAFWGCSGLTSITVDGDNPVYHSSGNCLIETESKTLIAGCSTSIIPSDGSVTSIGDDAFEGCSGLTSINIPDSVTSIGHNTFYNCSSLTSIKIPDSVTSIEYSAFSGCSSLTSIKFLNKDTVINNSSSTIPQTTTIYGYKNSTAQAYAEKYNRQFVALESEDVYSEGLAYTVNSDGTTCTITGIGTCTDTELYIPETIDGYKVTGIGEYAFSSCRNLTSINIPDSVTSVGDWAFFRCNNVESVTIGNSVTSIGNYAFHGCSSLTSVTIGNGVTSIGDWAFYDCDSLTSIEIPASVTSIGERAFSGCSGLTSITVDVDNPVYHSSGNCIIETESKTLIAGCSTSIIPSDGSVTSIGDEAFYDCDSLTSINIPDSVTSIGDWAFYDCDRLTSIEIPSSVTSIGGYAFENCSNLTRLSIPDSVTKIKWRAFSFCGNLESIVVDENNLAYHSSGNCLIETESKTLIAGCSTSIIPSDGSVLGIGAGAFALCSSLTSIEIPDGVTYIGSWAFDGCSNLTSINISESVTVIGFRAFLNCSSLTSIKIPASVTTIGEQAFYSGNGLTSITFLSSGTEIYDSEDTISDTATIYGYEGSTAQAYAEKYNRQFVALESEDVYSEGLAYTVNSDGTTCTVTGIGTCTDTELHIPEQIDGYTVTGIGDWAFFYCSSLTSIDIPSNVTSIGDRAFEGCDRLTSIEIPDSVTSIGNYAFAYCSSLTSIDIPSNVTSIGDRAFEGCDRLTSIEIPDSVTSIGNYAFAYCSSLTNIEIPSSVTGIGGWAFDGCSNLTSINIPDSVTSIGWGAFSGCSGLTSITVDPDNPAYHSSGNCLIETESKTLIAGCSTSIIPSDGSVTSIGMYAFYNCSSLTSINIPDSVTSIGDYAFWYCSSLTSIEIPDSVTSIGNYAFYNCSSLTSIEIPDSVTSIGSGAFSDCSGLTSITVDENNLAYHSSGNCLIETESKTLMTGCSTSIIPSDGSVTSIGNYAFCHCSSLTSIDIPDSVTSIGYYAFEGCSGLTSINIPDSVTSIGHNTFHNCSSLTSINIPDGITNIGTQAFYGCSSLTSIKFLNKNTSIYDSTYTISDTATIYGYEGSTAQAYAEKYNRQFVILEPSVEDLLGDVNLDGVVNSSDAVAILRYLAGYDTTGYNIANGDYNRDGVTNSSDAVAILRMLAGYIV